jgi:hypothetical protein
MQEGTMTARSNRQGRAVAKKPDPQPSTNRWDVIRYAIDDNGRTIRLCVIVLVVGMVLLLAVRLGLHIWL